MTVEAWAALLVGILAMGVLLAPLIWPGDSVATAGASDPSEAELEDTPRGQALIALKEIEFDRATGKLSDADYEELRARYTARALALLDSAAAGAAGTATGVPTCAQCGSPLLPDGQFCEICGTRITVP